MEVVVPVAVLVVFSIIPAAVSVTLTHIDIYRQSHWFLPRNMVINHSAETLIWDLPASVGSSMLSLLLLQSAQL